MFWSFDIRILILLRISTCPPMPLWTGCFSCIRVRKKNKHSTLRIKGNGRRVFVFRIWSSWKYIYLVKLHSTLTLSWCHGHTNHSKTVQTNQSVSSLISNSNFDHWIKNELDAPCRGHGALFSDGRPMAERFCKRCKPRRAAGAWALRLTSDRPNSPDLSARQNTRVVHDRATTFWPSEKRAPWPPKQNSCSIEVS